MAGATMDKAREIIARLEKATGPDRELDEEIYILLLDHRTQTELPNGPVGAIVELVMSDAPAPGYTASLDAAIALVERMLPGWGWMIERNPGGTCEAWLDEFSAYGYGTPVVGITAPIAILRALFKSLQERET